MSPSLQTMGFFMSDINFCNTKEQLNHLGEVVTGKVDGSPTGADIDTSTLPYTGQVRKTLPALEEEYQADIDNFVQVSDQVITDKTDELDDAANSFIQESNQVITDKTDEFDTSIANKEAEADAAIDSYRLLNKGPYASGIALESKFEYITYNGESYFAVNPPYTTTETTPDADSNLFISGYTTFENVANKIGNTNLLSNHNFIIQSPDAITHPNATPESYVAGTQIFSGVYAGDSGCTVTFTDGRVNCTAGDYQFKVPNTGGLERVPVFTSSVSDYDGIPKTTGVSHALVGDEYVVTVTPAAGDVFSVKFEQGDIATKHELSTPPKLTFDIMDYGADPSGVKDSGPAIRAAHIASLGDQYSGVEVGGDTIVRPVGEVTCAAKNGTFKILTPVEWSTFARFDGGGNVFYPDSALPSGSAMFTGNGYRSNFKNAVFTETLGSPILYNHLAFDLDSDNADQGLTVFDNIEFKGLRIGAKYDLQSSIVRFVGCKWDNVQKFIQQVKCDSCIISACWGTEGDLTGLTGGGSFDILGGSLHITDGSLFVPKPKTVVESAWVDMRGTHLVVDGKSRFGGEPGSKSLVNWRTKYSNSNPLSPRSLVIKDAWLNVIDGDGGDVGVSPSCLVRLFDVPNHIYISGNRGLVDTRHVIAWGRSGSGSITARQELLDNMETELYGGTFNINNQQRGRGTFNFCIENNSLQLYPQSTPVEYPSVFANLFLGKPIQIGKNPSIVKFSVDGYFTAPELETLSGTSVRIKVPVSVDGALKATVTLNTSYASNSGFKASQSAIINKFTGMASGLVKDGITTDNLCSSTPPDGGFISIPPIPTIDARFELSDGSVVDSKDAGSPASLVLDVTGMANTPVGWEDTVEVVISSS